MSTLTDQFIGPSFTRKAHALEKHKDRRTEWPYWWQYPPPTSEPVHIYNGIALQAPSATQFLVLTYPVPVGYVFVLKGVIAQIRTPAGAPVFASGDTTAVDFVLDVNQALGNPLPEGAPVRDFSHVFVELGNFGFQPFPIFGKLIFRPQDILRWKFTNLAVTVPGSGATVACGIFGFLVPEQETKS